MPGLVTLPKCRHNMVINSLFLEGWKLRKNTGLGQHEIWRYIGLTKSAG